MQTKKTHTVWHTGIMYDTHPSPPPLIKRLHFPNAMSLESTCPRKKMTYHGVKLLHRGVWFEEALSFLKVA